MELELIIGLLTGPAAGIAVAVYFLNRFMAFQKDVTDRLILEMKEDRSIFEDTVRLIVKTIKYSRGGLDKEERKELGQDLLELAYKVLEGAV